MKTRFVSGEKLSQMLLEFGQNAVSEGIWFSLPEIETTEYRLPAGAFDLVENALRMAEEDCRPENRSFIQFRHSAVGKEQLFQIRYSCRNTRPEALERLQQEADQSRCFFRVCREPECVRLQVAAKGA